MSDDLVTFNIRYEKSLFELKIETPEDVLGFVGKLKNELNVEDADEIVLLCPTPEGKMMEIKSDADINFLKKTKMCYDAVNRQIYCSVELVVLIPHKKLPDDPRAQIMILSKKVDQLASQFTELSQSIDDKLEKNATNILKDIKCVFSENMQSSSDDTPKTCVSDELKRIPKLEKPKTAGLQKSKKDKEKLSSSSNNFTDDSNQQKKSTNTPTDIDTLLEKLKQEGFSNTIQNIIALKRFDHDYDKVVTYLLSNSSA